MAESNMPENLEAINVDWVAGYFSEDILQNEAMTAFENTEVRHAYYSIDSEIIPIYIAECLSNATVRVFRADSGEEIDF